MTLIEQASGQGKTHTLVQWVLDGRNNDEFRALIVHDSREKDRLLKEYPDLTYQNIETFDTVRNHTYRPAQRNIKYAFDNVDIFIQRLFHEQFRGLNIDMISASNTNLHDIFGIDREPK